MIDLDVYSHAPVVVAEEEEEGTSTRHVSQRSSNTSPALPGGPDQSVSTKIVLTIHTIKYLST